jgi:hypothetical protein
VDMRMEDDVDTRDSVDLDDDVDLGRDSDDEEEEDEGKEHEEEVEEEDEEEEEDQDEDDGKEPQMRGQGEMVNTSADDVDTMVDNQPIVLPNQGQELCQHTPWRQHQAPAAQPPSSEPCPRPQTLETHPLRGQEHLGLGTPQKSRPAVPTLREAEPGENTSDVEVDVAVDEDQQLLIEWAGADGLPNVHLSDVPLPDVSLHNVPLPDDPLPEACRDGSVGEELTSPRVAVEEMVVAFR